MGDSEAVKSLDNSVANLKIDNSSKENAEDSKENVESGSGSENENGNENGDAKASGNKKKKKKNNKKKKKGTQTYPPSIGLSKIYKPSGYPVGEIQNYTGENAYRTTSAEKKHLEQLAAQEDPSSALNYNSMRRGAEAHREVRKYVQDIVKPGMSLREIVQVVEDKERILIEEDGLKCGIGFPTGVSLNHIAAHYTPNPGEKDIFLKDGDILKIDFGPHVSGRITDSAFTLSFNPLYDNLIQAVKDATNAGIKAAGIDVYTSEIGAEIQEVMESFEVEIDGKVLPVKSIRNLTGHSIRPYVIHGSKSVPIVAGQFENDRMDEGDVFAIETFGSTGNGYVRSEPPTSHYARNEHFEHVPLRLPRARQLLNTINTHFGTLPFCKRYLEHIGETKFDYALDMLVSAGIVNDYPPLADVPGCMTAQSEHTILLRPTCKEVLTRGDDY